MQSNKKKLALIGFICLAIVSVFSVISYKANLRTKSEIGLQIKESPDKTVDAKPGIVVDTSEPNQSRFWMTGTIDKIETVEDLLPANQTAQKQNFTYSLLQLTLSIPSQDTSNVLKVKALTVEASTLVTSTDGLNSKISATSEVEKNLQVGEMIRLNVINQPLDVYKSQWTQRNGQWNNHGEMMLYLINKYDDDTKKLLTNPTAYANDLTVVFDGLLYNQQGNQ